MDERSCHKAQVSMISIVIIAGIVVAMIGTVYVWAVPMIEKRITVTDYALVKGFMLDLNDKIVEIANTGSGQATLEIPKGTMEVVGYDFADSTNNTMILDFYVSQPIMAEGGSVPIETSSMDYIGEYGKTEPRVILVSRSSDDRYTHLNMSMRYRELRSSVPKGYIIAVCPSTGCGDRMSGGNEVTVSFDRSVVEQRDPFEGGDLTKVYINVDVS